MLFSCSVLVELFPPPSKPSGCDFRKLIDDYMTLSDESYLAWLKDSGAVKRGVSSSK
jgi:hypothetical protein